MFHSEAYVIAKAVFLRKRKDVYMDELVSTVVESLAVSYVLKMAVSLLTYAYIYGALLTTLTDLVLCIE